MAGAATCGDRSRLRGDTSEFAAGVNPLASHRPKSRDCLRENECMPAAVIRDPDIMHGTPVFRGTRVPVQTLFDYLDGGETLEDFLEGFPTITRELAIQAFEEAKHLLMPRD